MYIFVYKSIAKRVVKSAFMASWWIVVVVVANDKATTVLLSVFPIVTLLDTNIFYCNFLNSLHDRKICVLGMCTLLQLGPERLSVLQECHTQILPSMLMLFQGLKRAYAGLFGFMSVILVVSLFSGVQYLSCLSSALFVKENL